MKIQLFDLLEVTHKQAAALIRVYHRDMDEGRDPRTGSTSFQQFLRYAKAGPVHYGGDPVVMIGWKGMVLGIEPDGYTHS